MKPLKQRFIYHNRSFLFKFARDRTEYRRRRREAVQEFGISVLTYNRVELTCQAVGLLQWVVREQLADYVRFSGRKTSRKAGSDGGGQY